jgi:hypothetical protein
MTCNMCRDGKTGLGRPCPNRCPAPSPDHDKLIRWLRGLAEAAVTANGSRATFASDMYFEAAEAIASLQGEVERLKEALKPFAHEADHWVVFPDSHLPVCDVQGSACRNCGDDPDYESAMFTVGDLRRARAALSQHPGEGEKA